MPYRLKTLLGLLADFRVGIGGCLSKFLGRSGEIMTVCQGGAEVKMSLAEIWTNSNCFAILLERGVDKSAVFQKSP